MKQLFYVKIDGQLAMEVNVDGKHALGEVTGWLREAVDSLAGDTKECCECGQTTYKHQGYVCGDGCGIDAPKRDTPRLTLVKGRG